MREFSFYRLPLHDKKLLQRWLVNIRRKNVNVNEYSRVCNAHFERSMNQGKDDVPTLFSWNDQVSSSRAPPKECISSVPVKTSHSIGITTRIYSENHASICTKELIMDLMRKPW